MAWEARAVSTGQAFLVGDPEEDDFVLILTLGGDTPASGDLWCTFDHSFNCNHTERVKTGSSSDALKEAWQEQVEGY